MRKENSTGEVLGHKLDDRYIGLVGTMFSRVLGINVYFYMDILSLVSGLFMDPSMQLTPARDLSWHTFLHYCSSPRITQFTKQMSNSHDNNNKTYTSFSSWAPDRQYAPNVSRRLLLSISVFKCLLLARSLARSTQHLGVTEQSSNLWRPHKNAKPELLGKMVPV